MDETETTSGATSASHDEWVEIVEPQTRQQMFANLTTGQCAWDPPVGARVKRTHADQWWELFDAKTGRYYYYNASTMKTMWQRPIGQQIDIIPLAKLQTLKQNTNGQDHEFFRRNCETQTSPAVSRSARRVMAQNIGPETGIVRFRAGPSLSQSEKGALTPNSNGMARNFDNLSLDESTFSTGSGSRAFPPFPTTNTMCTMSSAPSSDSLPRRSSKSSSPPIGKKLFSTNTSTKVKDPKLPLSTPEGNKQLKKDAATFYKTIQSYMGERKSKTNIDQMALTLCEASVKKQENADEIVAQLINQLADNEKAESVKRGWELLAIVLAFANPQGQVLTDLNNFIEKNSERLLDSPEVAVSHFAQQCQRRLSKAQSRVKPTIATIQEARAHIFNPPLFAAALDEIMEMQSERFPRLQLPWLQTTLIELLYQAGGRRTEGLFRVAGDPDQIATAKARLDNWVVPVCHDAHVPASLIKQWLRQLPEPIMPNSVYDRALAVCENPQDVCRIVNCLPEANRLVLAKLISLLQDLSREEVVQHTKMDVSNLAMVMAPNVLRCESADPRVLYENARREMTFLKTLITHFDTAFIQGIN
ncbi:hypothetical protein WR25_03703 [Diploscapter pachys]|uniref:Rho-GAP domain-containing protein n=1 Tax=Diploscapter pachys TaxID=2018661 RepID=A0A2A2LNY1_9BILA|nr:hypothetical protein WR25_03703 [Diploscapter pachys]